MLVTSVCRLSGRTALFKGLKSVESLFQLIKPLWFDRKHENQGVQNECLAEPNSSSVQDPHIQFGFKGCNVGKKIMFYYFYSYKPAQIIITDAMNYIPVCVNFIIFYNSHI